MARPASIRSVQSDEQSSINMLIYGHPGEGKTVFWGTGEGVLILDSDHGTESARAQGSKADVMPCPDYASLLEAYEYLANGDHPYRWVVWDSLTLFQSRSLIDEVMADAIAENPRQEEFVPAVRHYLVSMNRVGRMVRNFTALPINFGISCLVNQEEDPVDGSTLYMPGVQGKNMPANVSGWMGIVGYLTKAEAEDGKMRQRLITRRLGRYYAKDRFDALGAHVDRPTLPKIEDLIAKRNAELSGPRKSPPARRRGTAKPIKKKEQSQ